MVQDDLDIENDYARAREQHANKKGVNMLTLAQARANKSNLSFTNENAPVKPKFIGRRTFKNIDLNIRT
jgi:5-methyltetrahydrofolate--homocysteine methyltransferase